MRPAHHQLLLDKTFYLRGIVQCMIGVLYGGMSRRNSRRFSNVGVNHSHVVNIELRRSGYREMVGGPSALKQLLT